MQRIRPLRDLGCWNLKFLWSLELGFWNFPTLAFNPLIRAHTLLFLPRILKNMNTPGIYRSLPGGTRLLRFVQISAILVCAAGAFRGIADAAVEVIPQRIQETRVSVFKDDKISRTPAGLKLTVALNGPEAEAATQSGRLKLEEAVDNTGASLIPHADTFHDASKFTDFENAFFRNSKYGGNTETAKPQVELELGMPARAAVNIAHLRGSLQVSDGGKTNTVELGGLNSPGKKSVPLPSGFPLTITVVVPDDAKDHSLNLETTGDDTALASIEVVDAAGKKISTGMSKWSMMGGPTHESLDLTKPLDASMKLEVKIISDRKITTVPFDLKNIPLP